MAFIQSMLTAEVEKPKQVVQQISLIKLPPPPPPPPEVEKQPEPKIEDKVDTPEPEESDDIPDESNELPEGDLLGLDAEGVAGGDGFGLIGRKGGRSLLGDGDGSGGMAWYDNILTQEISDYLYEKEEIRKRKYVVKLKIWISDDGSVRRIKLIGSTGDESVDKELEMALTEIKQFDEAPPNGLPQPVTVKITSRL